MANAIVGSGDDSAASPARSAFRWASAPAFTWPNSAADRFGDLVRFTADVLNGVPSIVMGIAAYALVVRAAEAFLGALRRRRAGHHDDSHGRAHHRRDAADGAAHHSRGGARAGHSAVARRRCR